ncbi:MAG TPA: SPOR domain-containing protein [Pseudomonadales bacterium]
MTRAGSAAAALLALALSAAAPAETVEGEQLVFGSFRSEENARRWAAELEHGLGREIRSERVYRDDGVWYRVRTAPLGAEERRAVEAVAAERGLSFWVVRGRFDEPDTLTSSARAPAAAAAPAAAVVTTGSARTAEPGPVAAAAPPESREDDAAARSETYLDVGLQTRSYAERGLDGQDRFQPSVSLRLEYHRAWDDGRQSLTVTPFVRIDQDDRERTHADLRELFWTRVGDGWELHVGARQLFWGVTEFNHLIDIVNQTDLVENIDGEDKLGQPMVQLSLLRSWGTVDLIAMSGFRERTFPGPDGRLRTPVEVDTDRARYESGAGRGRVDGVIRWSHYLGPLSVGVYHFSGTGRDPQFALDLSGGEAVLIPEYHVIDQTGLDAQLLVGDWAWKLEALRRSGHGDRYHAFTAGFERTLVGVLGSRTDLGLVVEYMYDQRDEAAFDTLFEHDLALGGRWRLNDAADTTALAGVIWDVETDEYVVTLEANRRLGPSWLAVLEARVFAGTEPLTGAAALAELLDGDSKSGFLQQDDFIQLELTRYF